MESNSTKAHSARPSKLRRTFDGLRPCNPSGMYRSTAHSKGVRGMTMLIEPPAVPLSALVRRHTQCLGVEAQVHGGALEGAMTEKIADPLDAAPALEQPHGKAMAKAIGRVIGQRQSTALDVAANA